MLSLFAHVEYKDDAPVVKYTIKRDTMAFVPGQGRLPLTRNRRIRRLGK